MFKLNRRLMVACRHCCIIYFNEHGVHLSSEVPLDPNKDMEM